MTPNPGFGLYIHWPFCLSKCPYCDFNSHVSETIDHKRWRSALIAELEYFAAATQGRTVTSLFFGGGTPSLMHPDTLHALIERVRTLWNVAEDLEITLEANPGTVDQDRFRAIKDAGVRRLSMGIQALNDADLRFLGRKHNAAEALTALEMARTIFERFSFDLIYARPEQSLKDWQAELTQALSLAGGHLSLYQLTIEPGTAFYTAFQRGDFTLPEEGLAADLFAMTDDMTKAAGLPAYEISNHAALGQECRHNLLYWLGGDYIGIGPGAHGRLSGHAIRQHRAPEIWLDLVERQGHGTRERLELDPKDRAQEMVMMGLRLTQGIDAALFKTLSGYSLLDVLDKNGLKSMIEADALLWDDKTLVATPKGRVLLNSILGQIL